MASIRIHQPTWPESVISPTMAAGVVAMSVGLFNSFNAEGNGGSGQHGWMCCPGDKFCTDESGTIWSEDRQVERDFPGDSCTNH